MKYKLLCFFYCLLFCFITNSCAKKNDYSFRLGEKFIGDGILIMQGNNMQDGWSFVTFFPVCRIDTADLLGSLKRAEEGIRIKGYHQQIMNVLRKRSILLTATDTSQSLPIRKIYMTSVRISFADTSDIRNESTKQSFQYNLETDEIKYEQKVFILNGGTLRADNISAL